MEKQCGSQTEKILINRHVKRLVSGLLYTDRPIPVLIGEIYEFNLSWINGKFSKIKRNLKTSILTSAN